MFNIKLPALPAGRFESKQIRTVWNEADEKWYFVIEDVVAVLTDSNKTKKFTFCELLKKNNYLACGFI